MSGPAVRTADAIVVAAGRSTRMGGADKLAVEIDGRPLLAWTLAALVAAPQISRIVVVTSPERRDIVRSAAWLPAAVVDVVVGGGRRQESVHAGFEALERDATEDGVVLVHDGARPLVSAALVASVVEAAAGFGAAIPIVPVAETLKRVEGGLIGATVDRTGLGAAQTPQGIRRDLLGAAYRRFPAAGPDTFTDEASLLEACGIPVHVVPGDPGNLKVTLPADLDRVAGVLAPPHRIRTGIGQDSHPFGPEMGLRLGGIAFPDVPRLAGHSDGDVALHALADALLGAAGQGDLGRTFPADARTPRGIDSARMLAEVLGRVETAGWRVTSVDLTIIAARPRLAAHLERIRDAIAAELGLAPSAVNVKASSGNLDGPDGAGRSISALAVATVEALR